MWRREARPLAYALIFWPLVELQDFISISIDMLTGKSDPSLAIFGVPILLLSGLACFAATRLLQANPAHSAKQ